MSGISLNFLTYADDFLFKGFISEVVEAYAVIQI
jgi:hypothetical protein